MKMNKTITFLGTGHGMPVASSCSSLLLEDDANNILFDAGGGHDLLVQFHKAKKDPSLIKNIFISHYDSDHILGIVPLVRVFRRWSEPIKRNVFCSQEVKDAIESLFTFVAKNHYEPVKEYINFIVINDGLIYKQNDWELTFFDIKSDKSPQYGCAVTFPTGEKLSFLGDEPLREHYIKTVENSDVLIHEAFCLDHQQEHFKPHPKKHSTVKEASLNATKIGAKQLVLYHMEDETLATRKTEYMEEAKKYFGGDIFVPIDLDIFRF